MLCSSSRLEQNKYCQKYNILKTKYNILKTKYNILKTKYNILKTKYNILKTKYNILKTKCIMFRSLQCGCKHFFIYTKYQVQCTFGLNSLCQLGCKYIFFYIYIYSQQEPGTPYQDASASKTSLGLQLYKRSYIRRRGYNQNNTY